MSLMIRAPIVEAACNDIVAIRYSCPASRLCRVGMSCLVASDERWDERAVADEMVHSDGSLRLGLSSAAMLKRH
jgi:hypothetical protein